MFEEVTAIVNFAIGQYLNFTWAGSAAGSLNLATKSFEPKVQNVYM